MIVQFIDLVMENPVIPYFKTIFDNHYNVFREDFGVEALKEESGSPDIPVEDIF